MKKNKSRIILIVLAFIGVLVLFSVNYSNEHTFTADKWINSPSERYLIVNDMVKRSDIKNMNRKQIIELLGDPEPKASRPGMAVRLIDKKFAYLDTSDCIFYFINGTKNKMPEEIKGFYIRFDENDKVADYSIIRFRT